MAARIVHIGSPAHEQERAAIEFIAEGLPASAVVYANPWLCEPSGAVYEVDAIVLLPHAIYVVEIKGWRGRIRGEVADWYLPEARRSPLLLAHKTAQVLHSGLARQSLEAGRAWVQELIFLPAATAFTSSVEAVRKRVALRSELHPLLLSPAHIRALANRAPAAALTDEIESCILRLVRGESPRPAQPASLAGFRIIDRLDTTERYRELLGEDATGTRRLLRLYHLPWQATEEERAAHLKRATWEAGVLRSLPRIPEDVRLPLVDQPVSTDEGVVVPMEHFEGQTLPAWLQEFGAAMDRKARVGLWLRLARALAWTHKAGVIHRGLRPELILVKGAPQPDDPTTPDYRITGFEIAKRAGARTTVAWSDATDGRLEGAAPEVVHSHSDATPAADQFSLGLLLAHILLRRPLVASTLAVIERRQRFPRLRDLEPELPQRLDDAVARMVERLPADRFPNLDDAIAAVAATLGEAPQAPSAAAPNTRLGADYLVEKTLGEGGLAEVIQIKHRLMGERYALKIARRNDTAERALRAEHVALGALQHPAIVKAHELTSMVEGRLSLRLALIEGQPLSTARLPEGDIATRRRLGDALLNALDECERVGITHNDLKPDNLMISDAGQLVIIDFSLARGAPIERQLGHSPTFGGTLDWRDPADPVPSHSTDRYAAALCLYYLHAGRHPYDGQVPEPDQHPEVDASELEPEALGPFFERALHPQPASRFRSAQALRDAYLAALGAPARSPAARLGPIEARTPLAETALSPRACRALQAAQVRTIGELLDLGADRLRRVAGLGPRLATQVQDLLAQAQAQGLRPEAPADDGAPPLFRPLADSPRPLADLDLPAPLAEALFNAGLRTLGDLARSPRDELRRRCALTDAPLQRLSRALVALHSREAGLPARRSLLAAWEAATQALDPDARQLVELLFGLDGPPLTQAEAGAQLGLDQPVISARKTQALAQLDPQPLADLIGALDGYLDAERGLLPFGLAAERLARDLHGEPALAAGLLRALCALDTHTAHLLVDVGEAQAFLARPWVERGLLDRFAGVAAALGSTWPPERPEPARNTLRLAFSEFEGDPLLLAQRLVPTLCTTASGALFQPPIEPQRAILYALEPIRERIHHAALVAEVDRVFAGRGPQVPPLHTLAGLLEHSPWRVDGVELVRRGAARPTAPAPAGDDPRALLHIGATVDPRDRVRDILRDVGRQGSATFRLVVAPPRSHRAIARSLIDHLGATPIDLTDAWFRRHAATLAADARAPRFKAIAVGTNARMDALMTELVAAHGAPGRTLVVHETGLLEALHALDQLRLLYTRVYGKPSGLWIVVIPGLIVDGRPLFNERTPTWHLPGVVLPLAEPLRA